jgi:hypothetical protein
MTDDTSSAAALADDTSSAAALADDTSSAAALERAIADVCLRPDASGALGRGAEGLRALLESHGVAEDDVAASLALPARLAVYRSLVRNGLSAVVARMLPRTRARLNAACTGRFDADFALFVDDVGPRTHYLRDVPAELLAWAAPRWRADPGVPEYMADLAAFELAAFAVSAADDAPPDAGADDVAIDRVLVMHPSARRLHFAWAVHELDERTDARDVPGARAVDLLAYRDPAHAVRWLELSPVAAAIVDHVMAGETLETAVAAAHAEQRAAFDPAHVARLLADLAERGIVVGARADSSR